MAARDPAQLRSLALIQVEARAWHAFEPVLEALEARGFEFGTPVEDRGDWVCEYGPLRLAFGPRAQGWAVSLPVNEDNVDTRALLTTLDDALRKLPGVSGIGWYKREAPGGPRADAPVEG